LRPAGLGELVFALLTAASGSLATMLKWCDEYARTVADHGDGSPVFANLAALVGAAMNPSAPNHGLARGTSLRPMADGAQLTRAPLGEILSRMASDLLKAPARVRAVIRRAGDGTATDLEVAAVARAVAQYMCRRAASDNLHAAASRLGFTGTDAALAGGLKKLTAEHAARGKDAVNAWLAGTRLLGLANIADLRLLGGAASVEELPKTFSAEELQGLAAEVRKNNAAAQDTVAQSLGLASGMDMMLLGGPKNVAELLEALAPEELQGLAAEVRKNNAAAQDTVAQSLGLASGMDMMLLGGPKNVAELLETLAPEELQGLAAEVRKKNRGTGILVDGWEYVEGLRRTWGVETVIQIADLVYFYNIGTPKEYVQTDSEALGRARPGRWGEGGDREADGREARNDGGEQAHRCAAGQSQGRAGRGRRRGEMLAANDRGSSRAGAHRRVLGSKGGHSGTHR
jgi:hypothetical protein